MGDVRGNGRNRELHLLWSEGGGVALTCGRNSRRITHDMSYSPGPRNITSSFSECSRHFLRVVVVRVCQRGSCQLGKYGGGGYVLGKPLNLSLWPSQATLQPCLGPFPNSQQRVRSCKTYVYIWATATSACAFSSYAVVAEGFHLDRSSQTRARLTADHAENNPTNHMPSFRYQEDRPPEQARIFLQHPFARRQPRQQLAICSGSSQRRNN